MTAEEYLKQYAVMRAEVEQKERLIRTMGREIFGGPSDRITSVMAGSLGRSSQGNYWDPKSLKKFKTELDKQEDRVRDMRNFMMRIINQIDGLDDGKDRALLNGYYVQGMTWGELARQMNYADVYVRGYLKAVALNHFDKKYHEFLVTYQHVTK
ncbi:hypothetical protein [Megasphaera sp.]|uniref:hypothetical protein n=1 Tax=Megasphaera sp. TaxID=2023260 RepID=UPI00266CB887|nr:hypothetical protein [uncultured Megasphaera sp.]MCI7431792.1 hypothetical protein [Megasphaera elsdenii]